MNLCKDCKNYSGTANDKRGFFSSGLPTFHYCFHDDIKNCVDGTGTDCNYARRSDQPCGKEGKLWEKK